MEQEPIEVRLVRETNGGLYYPSQIHGDLYVRNYTFPSDADLQRGHAEEEARRKGGTTEDWTLVPSAARAAEQARLAAFEALAARLAEGPEGLGDGEEYAGSWAILRDLRTLAALAPPAPPEGE